MESFELPLAVPEASPKHVPSSYYYALPVRPIYKSYPVYHPDHEPDGYFEELHSAEPAVVFDEASLVSEGDWIAAGRLVFEAPISYGPVAMTLEEVRDPALFTDTSLPTTPEGIMPFARYVVREKGNVELGQGSCAMCHTRVLDDGNVILGAQGNFPFERIGARSVELDPPPPGVLRMIERALTATPWLEETEVRWGTISDEEINEAVKRAPTGTIIRHGNHLDYPAKIPDLIGVADRKYLDATGLVRHRSIGDVMRYAATNQTLDMLSSYDGYIPLGRDERELPPPGEGFFAGTDSRYSDAQLYALAQFLYSLKPPPNANVPDVQTRRGNEVFDREGCAVCHTPPLYTNNALIPAPGFVPPIEHWDEYDILDATLGTDPTLALRTRRGTGYYKVPSLKGVWYRGPFQHNGAVATLEEWFDPERLSRVPGHEFGLELDEEERTALIAFLRTL